MFPTLNDSADLPIFTRVDKFKPASEVTMLQLFQKFAVKAGFSAHITSYSMRYGFVRDMIALGIDIETVKKLLHHTPTSVDARRHYQGDVTNLDVVAMRVNLEPESAENLDLMDRDYIFS